LARGAAAGCGLDSARTGATALASAPCIGADCGVAAWVGGGASGGVGASGARDAAAGAGMLDTVAAGSAAMGGASGGAVVWAIGVRTAVQLARAIVTMLTATACQCVRRRLLIPWYVPLYTLLMHLFRAFLLWLASRKMQRIGSVRVTRMGASLPVREDARRGGSPNVTCCQVNLIGVSATNIMS